MLNVYSYYVQFSIMHNINIYVWAHLLKYARARVCVRERERELK